MSTAATSKIVCANQSHMQLLGVLDRVAPTDAEILITGESGVGKELYAEYVHSRSRRHDRPFVPLNCSNLSGELFESEIFGHARGAFTGAHAVAPGIVGAAEGGTLFLDELDGLSPLCQAKLLRFVQSKEYRRLGETHLRQGNVRLITASNADLPRCVRDGTFRADLFFRVRVVAVEVSPLRQRRDDIPPLLEHFATKYAQEYGVEAVRLGRSAIERLCAYEWPGNVRELENCVRYLTCLQLDREVLGNDLSLGASLRIEGEGQDVDALPDLTEQPMRVAKEQLVADFERLYIDQALEKSGGNVTRAALAAKKHRRAFLALMNRYGVSAAKYRPSGLHEGRQDPAVVSRQGSSGQADCAVAQDHAPYSAPDAAR